MATKRLLRTFTATSDADGSAHVVHLFGEFTRPADNPGDAGEPPTQTEFILRDGRMCTRIAKGVYQVSDGSMTLRSDDPEAP